MAKATQDVGEQLDLIDVKPKNAKAITTAAKLYRDFMAERQGYLAKEIEQKQIVLDLIKKSDLKPLADGKIKFVCDGLVITVTPRDELVQVKEAKE